MLPDWHVCFTHARTPGATACRPAATFPVPSRQPPGPPPSVRWPGQALRLQQVIKTSGPSADSPATWKEQGKAPPSTTAAPRRK